MSRRTTEGFLPARCCRDESRGLGCRTATADGGFDLPFFGALLCRAVAESPYLPPLLTSIKTLEDSPPLYIHFILHDSPHGMPEDAAKSSNIFTHKEAERVD